ncbi:Trafficking protein particle complex subunit 4 [Lamellibrachia satsuma]|nr:Trafficking protein particle complex subunit 4 [Lamellibrachia satsuma]
MMCVAVGHTILAINGIAAVGRQLDDGRDIQELIETEENYPISIKFGRPKLTTNEKIMLAGMFHSLFAIASQLSPESRSSGIQMIETDTFKLHCSQTLTGIKFMVIADPKHGGQEALLKRLYEIYADYALKNPFYSIDMPIRCELFDASLQECVDQAERVSYGGV